MTRFKEGFSGFSVLDVEAAAAFYEDMFGCKAEINEMGILQMTLPGGVSVIAYPKPNHTPAEFTILNFTTDDLGATIDELVSKGVTFERYEGFAQDERGIADNGGPPIAWTKDPSGNVIAVVQA